ncbi:hypothetical protein CWB65_15580 [Pseudoalteromonas sp. S554]|nr:hypothetical protein CWB65_15580 [Pseudoalteromonas sp. S554]
MINVGGYGRRGFMRRKITIYKEVMMRCAENRRPKAQDKKRWEAQYPPPVGFYPSPFNLN